MLFLLFSNERQTHDHEKHDCNSILQELPTIYIRSGEKWIGLIPDSLMFDENIFKKDSIFLIDAWSFSSKLLKIGIIFNYFI